MDDVYLPGQVDSDEYPAEHPDLPPADAVYPPGAFPGAAGGFTFDPRGWPARSPRIDSARSVKHPSRFHGGHFPPEYFDV